MSRFRKYDGDSQNFPKFPTSDRIRSDPIGRKESPLQRKPRLNGLQNKTSPQSTLRTAFKYGPAKNQKLKIVTNKLLSHAAQLMRIKFEK